MNNLHGLFIQELKDLYDAEMQISEALQMMIDKTTNPVLKKSFELHLEQTGKQI